MAAKVDVLRALDRQENHPKSHSSEVKVKNISMMKQETGVFLQVNSPFRAFSYHAILLLLTCFVTTQSSPLSIKIRAKRGTELCTRAKELNWYTC